MKTRGKRVTNRNIKDKDTFDGGMINPCYSKLSRRMVDDDYVKEVLNDCKKHSDSSLDYIEYY